jgi:hypothetical protein
VSAPNAPAAPRALRRRQLGLTALVALVLGAGPTVGDVGSCGRTATDLDQAAFAAQRKALDCQRCEECALSTDRCKRACDRAQPSDVVIPKLCHPLAHDGEVCVHALEAASCSDYALYVDDVAPAAPPECDFCRAPAPTPSLDGGP